MLPRSTRRLRRLFATLSSTPTPFPPPEALSSATATKPFQPETWASLQPPPPSALHAFASRVKLFQPRLGERAAKEPPAGSALADMLTQAFTHNSFLRLHAEHAPPSEPAPKTNAEWESMGNQLLGMFAAEYVHMKWPHLPTRVVKAAVSAYVGPQTCADVAREWGLTNLVRWTKIPKSQSKGSVLHQDAYASVPRSVVALTYQHLSIAHARALTHKYFLSREVDLRPFIKFRDPMKALVETSKLFGRDKPVSRLIKETGRYSISPVFVVGVFSGEDKLGEGFGSSLRMGEFRAAEDALRRIYLTQTPPHLLNLPTNTFATRPASDPYFSLSRSSGISYSAPELGECETQYGSGDKYRVRLTGREREESGEAGIGLRIDPVGRTPVVV